MITMLDENVYQSLALEFGALARPSGRAPHHANGVKCNSQGQRPWIPITLEFNRALKGRHIPFLQRSIELATTQPGALPQGGVPSRASRLGCETFAFRAFGAQSIHPKPR
jgi:hypothetical protein